MRHLIEGTEYSITKGMYHIKVDLRKFVYSKNLQHLKECDIIKKILSEVLKNEKNNLWIFGNIFFAFGN